MFPGKDVRTMASREPDRQAIITKTATFLAMGGEIQKLGTFIDGKMQDKEPMYDSEVNAAMAK